MIKEKLVIEDKEYDVNIILEDRRSSRVSLTQSGINIRLPNWINDLEREKIIIQFKNWAINRLKEKPQILNKINGREYIDGMEIIVLGIRHIVTITLTQYNRNSCKIQDGEINFRVYNEYSLNERNKIIGKMLSKSLAKVKYMEVFNRANELNQMYFGKIIGKITLKNTSSRWGSCSSKGNINLSTRLFFAPKEVLDYVIIHELSHLIEHNHSRNFWNYVARTMPDYKEKIKWLKLYGHNCNF